MYKFALQILVLFLLIAAYSCDPSVKNDARHKGQNENLNETALKQQFIKANQMVIQKENDEMDYYAKSHQMSFTRTASGIRYYVYRTSEKGDSIREGMNITISYKLKLLNGDLCYSSEKDGKKTFEVGHENIESGIHKGVQYLKTGDHAILLIPSHLAHGLLGDLKKIPPQTPILYDIQIDL